MPKKRERSKILPKKLPTPKDKLGIGAIELTHKDWHSRSRQVWLPAASWQSSSATAAGAGTQPNQLTVQNLVNGSTTGTGTVFQIPEDYVQGPITLNLYYSGVAAFGAADSVVFSVTYLQLADSADTTATGTTVSSTETPGTAYGAEDLVTSSSFALGTPTAPNVLYRLFVQRIGGDAADDYGNTVRLIGALIIYASDL